MPRENKAAKIEEYLNEHPKASLRDVSKEVGVALSYVSKVRKRLNDIRAAQASKVKAKAKPPEEEPKRPILVEPPLRTSGFTLDESIEELRQAACCCPRGGDTAVYVDLPGVGPVPLGSIKITPKYAVLLSPL